MFHKAHHGELWAAGRQAPPVHWGDRAPFIALELSSWVFQHDLVGQEDRQAKQPSKGYLCPSVAAVLLLPGRRTRACGEVCGALVWWHSALSCHL